MNEKFQPGEEMFEDVEGHGWRGNAAPVEGDEVENHPTRGKTTSDDEDVQDHDTRA